MVQHFASLGFVPHALLQSALENMQFRLTHRPLKSQQQAIVVVAWVIKTVGVSQPSRRPRHLFRLLAGHTMSVYALLKALAAI